MNLSWLKRSSADESADDVTGTPDGPLLSCRGVDVAYDKVQVLFGVDLDVQRGEIVALLGTNGAGKSTLLKAVSGLVQPVAGHIWFDGKDITKADAVATATQGIVQVPGGKAGQRRRSLGRAPHGVPLYRGQRTERTAGA